MTRDIILENQIGFSRKKKRGYSKRHERRGGPFISPWASLFAETQDPKSRREDPRNVRRGRKRDSFTRDEAER